MPNITALFFLVLSDFELKPVFGIDCQQTLERTAHLQVDGTDWLRICAIGLEHPSIPVKRHRTPLPKSIQSLDFIQKDIQKQILQNADIRMFYSQF